MGKAAALILGIAIGIWLYKFFIINIIGRFPHKACDYCEFSIKKEELFPRRKDRGK